MTQKTHFRHFLLNGQKRAPIDLPRADQPKILRRISFSGASMRVGRLAATAFVALLCATTNVGAAASEAARPKAAAQKPPVLTKRQEAALIAYKKRLHAHILAETQKSRVSLLWLLLVELSKKGTVVVAFVTDRHGKPMELHLVQKTGSPLADDFALEAVTRASRNFPPPPPELVSFGPIRYLMPYNFR